MVAAMACGALSGACLVSMSSSGCVVLSDVSVGVARPTFPGARRVVSLGRHRSTYAPSLGGREGIGANDGRAPVAAFDGEPT